MASELDITKDVCPMTFVKVKIALANVPPSGTLAVLLKEEALKNVVASLKAEGHRVTGVTRRESAYVLEVRKNAGAG